MGFIFFILNGNSNSIENKILVKIENQIITSLDINNEYKYLIALNPTVKNSKKDDIIKLAKRSILQEKIKKIEIEKNFNNPKIPKKFLEQILQNVYSRIGIANLEDFKKYLISNNVKYQLANRQGLRCPNCKNPIMLEDINSYKMSYILPLDHGGTNDPTNLKLICPTCYQFKNNMF